MRAEAFFDANERERIQQAVAAAEAKTAGEIVPMVVTSSARYTEIELLGLIAGLFIGMVVEAIWSDPWSSPHFQLWPVIGAMIGFAVSRLHLIKRLLAPRRRITGAVRTVALASFADLGLHYTQNHTGILILISLLEHRVEVLADRGINQKVSAGTWDEIVHLISAGIRSGQACDAFCRAIERCGDILAQHFPRQADDRDELPNQLVTR